MLPLAIIIVVTAGPIMLWLRTWLLSTQNYSCLFVLFVLWHYPCTRNDFAAIVTLATDEDDSNSGSDYCCPFLYYNRYYASYVCNCFHSYSICYCCQCSCYGDCGSVSDFAYIILPITILLMFLFTLSMSVIENADMVLVVNKLVQQYFCSNCIYLTMLY